MFPRGTTQIEMNFVRIGGRKSLNYEVGDLQMGLTTLILEKKNRTLLD